MPDRFGDGQANSIPGRSPEMAHLKHRFARFAYFLATLAALAGALGAGTKWGG